MDEKPYKYENLPIPTYEEATSSRPTSSQSRTGPEEISDDSERQGLLDDDGNRNTASRRSNYIPPTVESARGSLDSLDGLDVESEAEVRREIQEMEMEDPNSDNGSHRSLLTARFKRFTSFTNSITSLHLPSFRRFWPSIRLPHIDWQAVDANRIVILGRLFGIVLIMGIVYLLVASDVLAFGKNRTVMGEMYDPESVRAFVQGGFKDKIDYELYLQHITEFPHLAGTEGSYVLGEWIAEIFKKYELENVDMQRFDVYMNYPRNEGRRVAIVEPQDQVWEAQIEEDSEKTPVFHGHSKSGDVTGPLIYANYGFERDFLDLKNWGISVEGAVVLVRHHSADTDSSITLKAAEDAGAVGYIIFSDPSQDEKRDPAFQNTPAIPHNSVRRDAVSRMSRVIGDVLSPGWPSTPGNHQRLQVGESNGLPGIPSIPISWNDASHLLAALQTHGKKTDGTWSGASDVEYWTGDKDSPKVNLKNLQDEERLQPIYNVVGRIEGWDHPYHKVVVGNHRDSWCLGATDPGTGTAIMLTMVGIFGELRRLGWRPQRTIEFISWDAGEYNVAGSTEHVENREEELRQSGIAYLNVGSAATGSELNIAASPVFRTSLHHILGRVTDPFTNRTIREVWEQAGAKISPIGAGGDFTPFQHIGGVSSIDLSFKGLNYPKGSCYDDNVWMSQLSQEGGLSDYASVLGQIWALLTLELADTPLVPLDVDMYVQSISGYIDDLEAELQSISSTTSNPAALLKLDPMRQAVNLLNIQVRIIEEFHQTWHNSVYGAGGFEKSDMAFLRLNRNNRFAEFESNFLDLGLNLDKSKGISGELGGLVNRTQYKHIITAPKLDDDSQVEIFPSIRQWMHVDDWTKAQEEVEKVAWILARAAKELNFHDQHFVE